MELDEAKTILNDLERWECRDHAFGDMELGWTDATGGEVAGGYVGGGEASVYFSEPFEGSFKGEEARELIKCGKTVNVSRNDSTGPDEFVEGQVMPGLSKGDVFHELTGRYLDGS